MNFARKAQLFVSGCAMLIPVYGEKLCERVMRTQVGLSGHVSLIDDHIAADRNLKPLNRFELWLMKPRIEEQKRLNQDAFRKACIGVMGEDPFVEDYYVDDPEYDAEVSRMLGQAIQSPFPLLMNCSNPSGNGNET